MRMQKKIFVLFVAVLALPSVLIFVAFARMAAANLSEEAIRSAMQLNDAMVANVDDRLRAMSQLTMQVYYNETFIEALGACLDEGESGPSRDLLAKILKSFINSNRYLIAAYLDTPGGTYAEGMPFISTLPFRSYRPGEPADEPGRIFWVPTMKVRSVLGGEYACFAARRDIRRGGKVAASLLLIFRESFFDGTHGGLRADSGQTLLILSPEGSVVSSSDRGAAGGPCPDAATLALLGAEGRGYAFSGKEGGERLTVWARSELTGWLFVNSVPSAAAMRGRIEMERLLVALAVPYACFFLAVVYLISRRVSRPLREFVKAIEGIGRGKAAAALPPLGDDEIGALGRTIEGMSGRIDELVRKVKEEEKSRNVAELRFLQMQANPHFVYNALNTIRWTAVINGQDNIEKMVSALSRLLRNIADPADPFVALATELELVASYACIQRMRYPDFVLSTDVPEGLLGCEVPKFVLQNLVENAIVHGLSPKPGGGSVRISARAEAGVLRLSVEDDGVGFDPAVLEKPDRAWDPEHAHTGIASLRGRVRLLYGEAYGIELRSSAGEGTAAEVRLPLRSAKEAPCPTS